MNANVLRMITAVFLLAWVGITPGHAQTATPSTLALANQYLDIVDFNTTFKTTLDLMLKPLQGSKSGDIVVFLRNGLDVGKLRQLTAEKTAEIYTEEELRAMVTFYSSPVGKSVVAKQPEFRAALTPLILAQIKELMAKYHPPTGTPEHG